MLSRGTSYRTRLSSLMEGSCTVTPTVTANSTYQTVSFQRVQCVNKSVLFYMIFNILTIRTSSTLRYNILTWVLITIIKKLGWSPINLKNRQFIKLVSGHDWWWCKGNQIHKNKTNWGNFQPKARIWIVSWTALSRMETCHIFKWFEFWLIWMGQDMLYLMAKVIDREKSCSIRNFDVKCRFICFEWFRIHRKEPITRVR